MAWRGSLEQAAALCKGEESAAAWFTAFPVAVAAQVGATTANSVAKRGASLHYIRWVCG
jgi:hypothetical protein